MRERPILEGRKVQTRRIARSERCPYGGPGDLLWVREPWSLARIYGDPAVLYPADDDYQRVPVEHLPDWKRIYERHESDRRPARFMPRWASRLTLAIVGLRIERLHEIDEADAAAEGFAPVPLGGGGGAEVALSARDGFIEFWRQLHGKCSWDANPQVWVIEFVRA